MERVGMFKKVSFNEYKKAFLDTLGEDYLVYLSLLPQRLTEHDSTAVETKIKEIYDAIKLPKRATSGSAGYDFFAPHLISLAPGESIKFPTGIKAEFDNGWVLQLYPRSGLGFKYRFQLDNVVGIIDSDYVNSDNEGHIFAKFTNDSREKKSVEVEQGQGYMQGIFLPFGITLDDDADGIRNGGFGSTTR